MKRNSILYTALGLVVLLGLMNYMAISLYLYWTIWWFDNVMHFLGGLSLGFVVLYAFYDSKAVFSCFILVMMLGGVWEVFEYVNGLTISTESYPLDVVHDLIADALGAISAILITKRSQESS